MIDVYSPADMFPSDADRSLAEELTRAVLKAEGVTNPGPAYTDNTAAYIHRLPANAVHTARTANARTVRVEVLTPPGVLDRAAQKSLVADITQIVAKTAGDPSQATRTWVLLREAAEGGWGVSGVALGKEEFGALAKKAGEAKQKSA
jgi:phenylpyruvate tautomerase PptA (4-oxalocrotonate tautomerase family)